MTDKKTLTDTLFTEKEHFEEQIQEAKNVLKSIKREGLSIDIKLGSMAAEYILDVLADPKYQEIYGKYMTETQISHRVQAKEPRFNWLHIKWGIERLVEKENRSRIEVHPDTFTLRYKLAEKTK